MTIVYDGDGNRVQETVAGVTTRYLVNEINPTGYVQVTDELNTANQRLRSYLWGLQLIGQRDFTDGTFVGRIRVYGLDGHGSVRYLTDSNGAITDTYDYDAFGNLIASTGTTPNNYLFAGEQFDPALGVYYNRARYYDQRQGRFWSMDTDEGIFREPLTQNAFLYAMSNPVNRFDPTGNFALLVGQEQELSESLMRGAQALVWGARILRAVRPAVAFLTAAALIASSIASSFGAGGSGASALNGEEGAGQEVERPIYRDAKGTNPGEFGFTDPTYPEYDKREISLLEIPKRDKKYVVPFQIRFRLPKEPIVTVGGIVDLELAPLTLQVRYSPKDTPGHWSLLGNLYDTIEEQTAIKQALSSFAKGHAQLANPGGP